MSLQEDKDYKKCPNFLPCLTNNADKEGMFVEFKNIHDRLDKGADKMIDIEKGIKRNRVWDKLIFIMGLVSLSITIFRSN
jgi:hypothetical protein